MTLAPAPLAVCRRGQKRRRPGDNNGDSPIDQDKGAPDERHARGVADAE
ncbi:Hypothetical protein ETEE_3011 [Edwardsiella anguillarum ET080813]|uniref:Uncharacterized protein n=1 Tax=Edwardsiella anguillarum ET080813 TaxID=667120 RepID=A0A076LLS4_9GAMM|nr:Hypothetical protein ETEE_3011 [Edwardsiella anguillarum ET080813]